MVRIITIVSVLVIFLSVVNSHQSNPFQPFLHYLKSNENFKGVSSKEDTQYRLGKETKPSFYDVKLNFIEEPAPVFSGDVEITFQALEIVSQVVLNAEQINITNVKIYQKNNEAVQVYKSHDCDNKYQKCTFNTTTPLQVRIDYVIKIQYKAKLHEDLLGVYSSEYQQGNDTKKLIATHFGQFARRMMPCWDEPRFKASFKFTITRDAKMRAFSNAALEKPSVGNVDIFKPTSTISPYILALVVSEFDEKTNGNFSVITRPSAINDAAHALDVGPKLIKAFDKWTNMPYHDVSGVDKMTLGAIPDFLAGAMENWGLILHQELYSLYNKDYANTAQKQLIPTVVSHELAHMWFGDIVTCDWFDETYLNEGFARYFQFIGLDEIDSTYKGMMQFPVTSTQRSMQVDSSLKSFPLSNKGMFDLPEIRGMFGPISYDKGGSILRMAHNIMGDTSFKTAIRSYLKKREFQTAVTEDLMTELEAQYPGIVNILGPFIHQAGYPVVTVISREKGNISLRQSRFLLEGEDKSLWNIPITVATTPAHFENVTSNLQLLKLNETLVMQLDIDSYYIINVQQVGFYRVNYDTENWLAIGRALKSQYYGQIHVLNRAQIVDDLFNLARAGHLTYDFIFTIINYIRDETHYLPWLSFFNGLSYLHQRIVNDPLKTQFNAFVNHLLGPITDSLSFEDNGEDFWKMNRIQVLQWSCKYGNQEGCIDKAMAQFEKVMNGDNIVSDHKPAVYCTGLRETFINWDKMWARYVASNYATEQEMILNALGCARNTTDINKFLDKILTKEIRLQDKPTAYVSAVSGNLENVDIVLDYIIKNTNKWAEVMDVVWTLGDLSARFTNTEQFEKFEKHANTLKEEWKKPLLEISKENRKLLDWDKARLSEIKQFLDNSVGSKSASLTLILLVVAKLLFF